MSLFVVDAVVKKENGAGNHRNPNRCIPLMLCSVLCEPLLYSMILFYTVEFVQHLLAIDLEGLLSAFCELDKGVWDFFDEFFGYCDVASDFEFAEMGGEVTPRETSLA